MRYLSMRTLSGYSSLDRSAGTLGDDNEGMTPPVSDLPRLVSNPLSFHDDFRVIGGIPVLSLERTGCIATTSAAPSTHSHILCHATTTTAGMDSTHKWTVAGYEDGVLCVWDADHGTLLGMHEAHQGPVTVCHWVKDGKGSVKILSCDAKMQLTSTPGPSASGASFAVEGERLSWNLCWDDSPIVTSCDQATSFSCKSDFSLQGIPTFTPNGKYCCVPVSYQVGTCAAGHVDSPSVVIFLYFYDMEACPNHGSAFHPEFRILAQDGNMNQVDEMQCTFSSEGDALFLTFVDRKSGLFSSWLWPNWQCQTQGHVLQCGNSSECFIGQGCCWLGSAEARNLKLVTWNLHGHFQWQGESQGLDAYESLSVYDIHHLDSKPGDRAGQSKSCSCLSLVDSTDAPCLCTLSCLKESPCEGVLSCCQTLSHNRVIAYVDGSRTLVVWDTDDENPVDVVPLKLRGVMVAQEEPVLVTASPEGNLIAVAHLALDGERKVVCVQLFDTDGMFKIMDAPENLHDGLEANSIQHFEFGPDGANIEMVVDHCKMLVWFPKACVCGATTVSLPIPQSKAIHSSAAFHCEHTRADRRQSVNDQRHPFHAELVFSHDGSVLAVLRRSSTSEDLPANDVIVDLWSLCDKGQHGRDAGLQVPFQTTWKGLHHISLSNEGSKCAIVAREDCSSSMRVLVWNIGKEFTYNRGGCMKEETLTYEIIEHGGYIGGTPIGIAFCENDINKDRVVICNADATLVWMQTGHKGPIHTSNTMACPGAICCFSSDGKYAAVLKNYANLEVWNLHEQRIQSTHCIDEQLNMQAKEMAPVGIIVDGCWIPSTMDHYQYKCLIEQMRKSIAEDCKMSGQKAIYMALDDGRTVATSCSFKTLVTMINDKGYREKCGKCLPTELKFLRHTYSGPKLRKMNPPILTASGNGRMVAGMLEYGSVRVWTPFSTSASLPDYHRLDLQQCGLHTDASGLQELLGLHGVALLNHHVDDGMSFFLRAIEHDNLEWVKIMLKWAATKAFTVRLTPAARSRSQLNALDLALQNRNAKIVGMVLDAMFGGLTRFEEAADVMERSFFDLLCMFPRLVQKRLCSGQMLLPMGKLDIPVTVFHTHEDLIFGTHKEHCSSDKMVRNLWAVFGTRLVNASNSRCAWSLWGHCWEIYSRRQTCKVSSPHKMTISCKAVPFSNIAQIGRYGILRQLRLRNFHSDAFDSTVLQGVLSFKWNFFARRMFLQDLIWHTLLLFSYSAYMIEWGALPKKKMGVLNVIFTTLEVVTMMVVCARACWKIGIDNFFTFRDLVLDQRHSGGSAALKGVLRPAAGDTELQYGWKFWARSKWHGLEIVAYIGVVMTICFRGLLYNSDDTESQRIIQWTVPLTFLLLWWKMMYYGQAFQSTGPLVITIFQILNDVSFFLVLLAANFLGFAFAFHVLFDMDRREICNSREIDMEKGANFCDAFDGWDRTSATVFVMMLGQFNPEVFFTSSNSGAAMTLFILYLLLSAILLLNLLIAIIADSSDRVRRHATAQFLHGRAQAIEDMEGLLMPHRKRALREKIGRYLYVLIPEDEGSRRLSLKWRGQIAEMEKVFKEQVRNIEEKLQGMDEKMEQKNKEMAKNVEDIKLVLKTMMESQEHPGSF